MAKSINKHIEGLCDQFGVLVRKHKSEIAKMVAESETESSTIPFSAFISNAPGTERVSLKMTLTKKEVFSEGIDIESEGQERLATVDDEARANSLSAKQKDNAAKEKVKKKLAKKGDKDAPQ